MSELLTGGSWAGGWDEPGVLSIVLIAAGTPGSGLFVYSGVPANGNLIDSIAATGGTDLFGNTYNAGINSYQTITHARSALNSGAVFTVDGSGNIYSIQTSDLGAGPSPYWQVSTPAGNVLLINNAGQLVAQDPNNAGQPEAWHAITLDVGWTGSGRYKLMPESNFVYVELAATHAAFTVATNLNNSTPISAPYHPLSAKNIGAPGFPNRAGAEITGGVFIAEPNGVSCTECDIQGMYPLD